MPDLPRTYQVVRQGELTPVTVGSKEDVLALRTELELMSSFAQGATPEVLEALEARLAAAKSEQSPENREATGDIEDMLGILRDAMNPSTSEAMIRMDADFPEARGEIDMASVEKESGDFHEDVGKQVAASGKPAAGKLSQMFKQALLKNAIAAKEAAAKPSSGIVNEADGGAGQASAQQAPPADEIVGAETPDPVETALQEAVQLAEGTLDTEDTAVGQGDLDTEESCDDLLADEADEVEEAEEAEVAEEALEADEVVEAEEAVELEGEVAESLAEMAELAEEIEGQDPVEAALAEAIEEAAELDEQTGDPVGAALAEAVQISEEMDPIEAILAEQSGESETESAVDPVGTIIEEQAASEEQEMSAEQLADVLLAGQIEPAPVAEEIDEAVEQEWAEAVQIKDPSQLQAETGSVEQNLKYAGERMERGEPNADQNTVGVSQDAAGDAGVAAQEVAQELQSARSELDEIAAAFTDATSSLNAIEEEVGGVVAGEILSDVPESDIPDTAEIADLTGQADALLNESGRTERLPGIGDESAGAAPGYSLPSLSMREELQGIRQTLQSGLEKLIRLLDHVDQVHIEAENRLARARTFQQAAQKAQEVSGKLVEAHTDAAAAKAAYETAQRRLDEAQALWEDARRAAEDASF